MDIKLCTENIYDEKLIKKLEDVIKIFNHKSKISKRCSSNYIIEVLYTEDHSHLLITDTVSRDNYKFDIGADKKTHSSKILKAVYDYFSDIFASSPYGMLTGVRPTKLLHSSLDKHLDLSEIQTTLYDKYRLSHDKTLELYHIAKIQRRYLNVDNDKISLYISIPFCASRCVYCSFPSYTLDKNHQFIEKYIERVCLDLEHVKKYLEKYNREIDVIYVGGGTPAVLDERLFNKLLTKINDVVNNKQVKEYTVEAGRPEFITDELLDVFTAHGVNRISINPQTMNDKTLQLVNRTHTVDEVIKAYNLAKNKYSFIINMDVIVGLPYENRGDIDYTMSEIMKLDPDNLTVHSLAVKSNSHLKTSIDDYQFEKKQILINSMENIKKITKLNNYLPYYLYRQKNMLGSFENIGFTKADCECIYNIRIMEERHNILALGVGSVSKKLLSDKIIRIENYNSLEKYIDDNDKSRNNINMFFT